MREEYEIEKLKDIVKDLEKRIVELERTLMIDSS